VTAFFLPIFFTYTGLRTDIGTLETPLLWGLCGLVSAAAVIGKFGGCGVAARLSGFPGREAACIGVMMNTRALMELVVINTGYDMGVLTRSSFCMLVIMAVLTTVMTTPILMRCMRGTELEAPIRASGFPAMSPPAADPVKPDEPGGPSPAPVEPSPAGRSTAVAG
jgi:Kef-type K+ transport system membrane component KefB